MLRFLALAVVIGIWTVAAGSAIADEVRNLRFSQGRDSVTVSGGIEGYDGFGYLIDVNAGQQIIVSMSASNDQAVFNVTPPGSQSAVFNGSVSGNSFSGTARRSGKYRIDIYLMRAAARRGEDSDYRLSVTVPAGDSGNDNDFADGDAGGPDNWIVTGVSSGDRLNVRSAPSARASLVARIRNGSVVRNLGCRRNNGSRWCRISLGADTGVRGWVNGRFLREY